LRPPGAYTCPHRQPGHPAGPPRPLLTTLALIGASIEKVALEIRHLQRTEVREAEESFGAKQKGSSAMPHKRNPVLSENLCGLARVLRGNALTALENVALWHERDISHSSAERIIIPDSTMLLDFMIHRLKGVLANLVVYPEQHGPISKPAGAWCFPRGCCWP
jgi:adenylosuccinate lyase